MATSRKECVHLKIETEGMRPEHIRAIRSLSVLLQQVLNTTDESEFFEGSAECMRICASLIKQSRFSEGLIGNAGIPYAEQALEYSMDVLQDHIGMAKVISYDN